MNVNEGIDGVIGGRPCIGETGAGGYAPILGWGSVMRPGAVRVIEEAVAGGDVLPLSIFEDVEPDLTVFGATPTEAVELVASPGL